MAAAENWPQFVNQAELSSVDWIPVNDMGCPMIMAFLGSNKHYLNNDAESQLHPEIVGEKE